MSRTDRLDALIERGFAHLDDGDLDAAARQLELAQRIDARAPDVIRLDGELAAAEGDAERALARFGELAELDPEDATPWISAAAVALYSLGDPEAAVEHTDRALERVDDEEHLIEAVLLRAEALVALGRPDEAREALGELATSAIDDPHTALAVGDAHVAAEDGQGALRWLDRIVADDEVGTDALYASGWAYELLGDDHRKIEAWREVRARDGEEEWPEWHLAADEFERIAAAALDELPARAKELLADVPILIDDLPAEGLVDDGFDPRALGLIDGPNLVEQSVSGRGAQPVNIFLYQKNLERSFDDPDELAEQIRITVLHETAHYFGLEEDDLHAIGLD